MTDWSKRVWFEAADTLLKTAVSGSINNLILALDTIFKQRPDLSNVLFFFDVWHSMLHGAGTAPSTRRWNKPGYDGYSSAIYESCAILDKARTAVIGNVTPRTAIAAALLEVHKLSHVEGRAISFDSTEGK